MKTLRVIYHLALADFFERVRRYSFLLTLGAAILLGVLVNNGTMGMNIGSGASQLPIRYHGELNSAWISSMTVMLTNTFLGLLGFYLVSDCIKRDIRTGVGQIIATTPVSRGTYLVGKWISNFVVLALLVLILAMAAVIMVLLQSDTALDLEGLLMPFLAVALPYMALTAALAVVFETIPWLRGALGNVVYFFIWCFLFTAWQEAGRALPFLRDPIGYNIFGTSLHASARAAFPNEPISAGLSIGSLGNTETQFRTFNWTGVDWTPGNIGWQWSWALLGLGLVLLSAIWFARFDPSREGRIHMGRKIKEEGKLARLWEHLPLLRLPSLSPFVSKLAQANPFLGVLFAELRMLLNGRRWWWWGSIAGVTFAIFVSSVEIATTYLNPMLWLLPVAIWSEMGNRERKNNTAQIVFSSSRPVLRQLPAAWLAGVLVTALLCMGAAVFYLSNSDLPALAGWAGAVVFVPSLALALGVFSSSNRMFEVVYVIWWYAGVMSQNAAINFTAGAPQVFLLLSAWLLLLSTYWRGRQVRV